MTSRILTVDPSLALTLAYCAYEAYYPTRHTPPPGYKYVNQWTGKNPSVINGGDVEPYGLIFQNISNPSMYIFSFKGTASWMDAYEDIFIHQVPFVTKMNSASVPVNVADGFNAIYTTDMTAEGNNSMQNQLFSYISSLKPSKLIITGHSLGSALAELFTFDLYVSYPALPFFVEHYNFACPRVGDLNFAKLYRAFESKKATANKTLRIVNFKDEIPCLPPEALSYYHGPDYFLIDFEKKDAWVPHYEIRHSIYNYWQVLQKVVYNTPQVYGGEVTGMNGIQLVSIIPDNSLKECEYFCKDVSE